MTPGNWMLGWLLVGVMIGVGLWHGWWLLMGGGVLFGFLWWFTPDFLVVNVPDDKDGSE